MSIIFNYYIKDKRLIKNYHDDFIILAITLIHFENKIIKTYIFIYTLF